MANPACIAGVFSVIPSAIVMVAANDNQSKTPERSRVRASHIPLTVFESSNASRTCSMVYSPRFLVMFSRPSQWS